MDIPLHGRYSDEDIEQALALMRGRAFQVLGILVVVAVIVASVPYVAPLLSGEADAVTVLSVVVPPLVVLGAFAFLVRIMPRRQARRLRQAPLFRGPVSGRATDEALELESEQSAGRTKWSAFVQYKMSDQIVVLYQNKAAAMIVPRGFFASDDDWQRFRQHVQATVPDKAPAMGIAGFLSGRWLLYALLAALVVGAVLVVLLAGR
jgi:hypothetical protein